jgi:hypothetical protein
MLQGHVCEAKSLAKVRRTFGLQMLLTVHSKKQHTRFCNTLFAMTVKYVSAKYIHAIRILYRVFLIVQANALKLR